MGNDKLKIRGMAISHISYKKRALKKHFCAHHLLLDLLSYMFIKELLFAKNIRDGCFFCLVKLILEKSFLYKHEKYEIPRKRWIHNGIPQIVLA
jgi:hypothetical protein